MHQQDEINGDLRMVLVDWLVEVQQSFLLNHESLYIAVKLIDLYASRRPISKSRLQLLGAVALNLAAKFDVTQSLLYKLALKLLFKLLC